eukprot:1195223-Prorocentrum_minimum.AAC.1
MHAVSLLLPLSSSVAVSRTLRYVTVSRHISLPGSSKSRIHSPGGHSLCAFEFTLLLSSGLL